MGSGCPANEVAGDGGVGVGTADTRGADINPSAAGLSTKEAGMLHKTVIRFLKSTGDAIFDTMEVAPRMRVPDNVKTMSFENNRESFENSLLPLFKREGFDRDKVAITRALWGFKCKDEKYYMGFVVWGRDFNEVSLPIYQLIPKQEGVREIISFENSIQAFFDLLDDSEQQKKKLFANFVEQLTRAPDSDDEWNKRMKEISIPHSKNNNLYSRSFDSKSFFERLMPLNVHPYSAVIGEVLRKVVETFKDFHSRQVTKECLEKKSKSDKPVAKKLQFCYRVVYLCMQDFKSLVQKLVDVGGHTCRSVEYFNWRRYTNYLMNRGKKLGFEPSDADIIGFLASLDITIFSLFNFSHECKFFETAGNDLVLETVRGARLSQRRRKSAGSDSDDEGESDDSDDVANSITFYDVKDIPTIRTTGDDDVDDDGTIEVFDSNLQLHLKAFMQLLGNEALRHSSEWLLKQFKSKQKPDKKACSNLLFLIKATRLIFFKCEEVKDSITIYTFIPNLLYDSIPDMSKFSAFRNHLKVLMQRFPKCLWSPETAVAGAMESGELIDEFKTHLSYSINVVVPPTHTLFSAAEKILQFFGAECEKGQEIVTAMRMVNEGGLGKTRAGKGKGKVSARSTRRTTDASMAQSLHGGSAMDAGGQTGEGGVDGESAEAGSSSKKRRTDNGIISANQTADDVDNSPRKPRARVQVARYNDTSMKTQMSSAKTGLDIPEIAEYRQRCVWASAVRASSDFMATTSSGSGGGGRGSTGSIIPTCPEISHLSCPDPTNIAMQTSEDPSDASGVSIVSYSQCKLKRFVEPESVPDHLRERLFVQVSCGKVGTIVNVEACLVEKDRQESGKKRVQMALHGDDWFAWNINAPKRRAKSTELRPDDAAEVGSGNPRSFSFEVVHSGSIDEHVGGSSSVSILGQSQHEKRSLSGRRATSMPMNVSSTESIPMSLPRQGDSQHTSPYTEQRDLPSRFLNLQACGKMVFGKEKDSTLYVVNSKRLYELCTADQEKKKLTEKKRASNSRANESHEKSDDDSSSSEDDNGEIDADDCDYTCSDSDDNGEDATAGKGSDDQVSKSETFFSSFGEMIEFSESIGYELMNPVSSFGLIYNPMNKMLLISPYYDITKTSLQCVCHFLQSCPGKSRVIHGPVILQARRGPRIESLNGRDVSNIAKNIQSLDQFRMFTPCHEEGTRLLMASGTLETQISSLIPSIVNDISEVKVRSLFQMCQNCTCVDTDMCAHRGCNVSSNDDLLYGVPRNTTLSDCLRRQGKAERLITNVNAVYQKSPMCYGLFADISQKKHSMCLVGSSDRLLKTHGLRQPGKYVYGMTFISGTSRAQFFTVDSEFTPDET